MIGKFKTETCYPQTFGHRPIYTLRRFHIFMRRHHHFSFDKDFIHNQWTARPTG